jgi:hypothetical protein
MTYAPLKGLNLSSVEVDKTIGDLHQYGTVFREEGWSSWQARFQLVMETATVRVAWI